MLKKICRFMKHGNWHKGRRYTSTLVSRWENYKKYATTRIASSENNNQKQVGHNIDRAEVQQQQEQTAITFIPIKNSHIDLDVCRGKGWVHKTKNRTKISGYFSWKQTTIKQ